MTDRSPLALILLATFVSFTPAVADTVPVEIYAQSFDRYGDGTVDLGDGTVMAGNAVVVDGQLQLSTNNNFVRSAFWIPPVATSVNGWIAEFDYSIRENFSTPPADGFSLSYGNVPPNVLSERAEEGFPGLAPVLSFEMDSWIVEKFEVGPAIAVNDVDIPGGFINGPILFDGQAISGEIRISMDPDGVVSFSSTGAVTNAAFVDLPSGFQPDGGFPFVFAARTGGANQEVRIDNLRIFVQVEPTDTIAPITSVVRDDAADAVQVDIPTSQGRKIGIEYSPDLSPGSWTELGNFSQIDNCISRFIDLDPARANGGRGYYRAFLRPLSQ